MNDGKESRAVEALKRALRRVVRIRVTYTCREPASVTDRTVRDAAVIQRTVDAIAEFPVETREIIHWPRDREFADLVCYLDDGGEIPVHVNPSYRQTVVDRHALEGLIWDVLTSVARV